MLEPIKNSFRFRKTRSYEKNVTHKLHKRWLREKFSYRSQNKASTSIENPCHNWAHWIRYAHSCTFGYCSQHSEKHCRGHSKTVKINKDKIICGKSWLLSFTWRLKVGWLRTLICLAAERVICFDLANLLKLSDEKIENCQTMAEMSAYLNLTVADLLAATDTQMLTAVIQSFQVRERKKGSEHDIDSVSKCCCHQHVQNDRRKCESKPTR